MAAKKGSIYGDGSITQLKGADRVRKRPGVIFGSDGLEGCQHAFFEILSNSIDEAREGYGKVITVTRYNDKSIQIERTTPQSPLTGTPTKRGIIGSLYIASSMPEESIRTTRARIRIMSFLSD